MMIRWAVAIDGIDLQAVTPDQLHAAVSHWVDDDHRVPRKPWSVAKGPSSKDLAVLLVSTLNDSAAQRIVRTVTEGLKVRLGRQVGVTVDEPQRISAITWEQLANTAHEPSSWCVEFMSPTAFGKGGRFSPWPDPAAVTRSLLSRWNHLAELESHRIAIDLRRAKEVWVSDLHGKNDVLELRQHQQGGPITFSGFLGRIRYVCDDPSFSSVFDRLLGFAQYAGMGRYTTHGLGTVRLLPTWS